MANNSYFGQQVPQQSNQNYTYQPWGSGTASQQPAPNFSGNGNQQQQYQQYGNNFQRTNSNDGNWYPGNSYGPNQPQNINQRGNYYQSRPHSSNNNLNPSIGQNRPHSSNNNLNPSIGQNRPHSSNNTLTQSIGPNFDSTPPPSNYNYGQQNWTDSDYGNEYKFYSGGSINTYGSSDSYSPQNTNFSGNKRGTFNERPNQTMMGIKNQNPYSNSAGSGKQNPFIRNNPNLVGSGKPNSYTNNNPNQFGKNKINQFNNNNSHQHNPFGNSNPNQHDQFGYGNTNHFENKNHQFGTTNGNNHKKNPKQMHKKQQKQKKKMKKAKVVKGDNPEANNFYCDTCDRGFSQECHYTEHCGFHEKCSYTGCSFVAAPKLVKLHVQMQHKSGLAKKIWSVESQEDIEKWKEERRMKFPTTFNIEKKKAILEEKKSRGEVLETKYFGKMKGKNFNGQQNNGDDACPGDKNVRGKRNRRRKKPMIEMMGDAKVPKLDQSEGHEGHISDQSDKEGVDKPFITDEIKAMIKQRNTLHYKAKRTGDQDDWSKYRIIRAQCRRLTRIEKEQLGMPTQRTKRVLEKSEAGDAEADDKSEAPVHVEEKTTDSVNKDVKCSISKDEEGLEEQDKESWDWKRGKRKYPQRRRSDKANKFGSDVRQSLKSTPSLLEKLLANDIRHERNVILQCVHHVVKNIFFGIGDKSSTNEINKQSSCDKSVTNEINSQSDCETGPSENKVRRIDTKCESTSVNHVMQCSKDNTTSNETAEQPNDEKMITNENTTEASNKTVTTENITQSDEKAELRSDDKTISNRNTKETSYNSVTNGIIELSSEDNAVSNEKAEQSSDDKTLSNGNTKETSYNSVTNGIIEWSSDDNTVSNEKAEQSSDDKTLSNGNTKETSYNSVTNGIIELSNEDNTESNEKAELCSDDKIIANGNTDETSENTLNNEIIELSSDDNMEQSSEDNIVINENAEQACQKKVSNRQNFPGNPGTRMLLQNVHTFLNLNK
ncbi:putative uncharacterized protein DDB_G0282133 [Mytilus trossulus]|uniref:putative uncharacterized protein DDB_G0282133 n=1 Tax=Mytilus trossulus TaxID=6551 RepID=UPI0030057457